MSSFNQKDYPRPSVAADVVIFTVSAAEQENYRKVAEPKLEVLLIKRSADAEDPYQGKWALPGGFVGGKQIDDKLPYDVGTESTEKTALIALKRETGIEDAYLKQLFLFSNPKRDKRGWIMSCAYMALVNKDSVQPRPGKGADEAGWFQVDYQCGPDGSGVLNLTGPASDNNKAPVSMSSKVLVNNNENGREEPVVFEQDKNFGFDHSAIIVYAIERLREELYDSDSVFNLMPERFTLTHLQKTFEIILGKELFMTAFRRKIQGKVVEIKDEHGDNLTTKGLNEKRGHRPSQYYKKKDID